MGSTATAMERQLEINLVFFKIKIRFPAIIKHQNDTLSRTASDWEFYKMKSERTRPGRSFTKSHLMLDLIADLENNANSEVEEEGEVYHELEENVEVKSLEELQEHYSQIKNSEMSEDYQLPENCTSEDIYELVETLQLPSRVPLPLPPRYKFSPPPSPPPRYK